ncbi:Hypothetical predicted protein [Octopus vulgaris]|uniref:Uncharacterized protein n=1 Tax=Octopus vulgaris TaxID=6645 RepID=A0AA36B4Y7_OCTVU|nr:Hypothetical predicted protein [Octopus vulgaris]
MVAIKRNQPQPPPKIQPQRQYQRKRKRALEKCKDLTTILKWVEDFGAVPNGRGQNKTSLPVVGVMSDNKSQPTRNSYKTIFYEQNKI